MPLPPKRATCHPERWNKSLGFCNACYQREWKRTHRALCHPDRADVGKGVCAPCYQRAHGIKRIHSKRPPGRNRRHTLAVYGLTPASYDELLAVQGGGCAICGKPPAEGKHLHVDHDHKTAQVRGLLCRSCNRAIGFLEDDRELIERAADYVAGTLPPLRVARSA
jgi:Recombination endonuclease VII